MKKRILLPFVTTVTLYLFPAASLPGQAEAEQAVMEVMFDFDQISSEQYVFRVRSDGFVEITLDDDITGDLLNRVLKALQSHPDISGVLLSSADICAPPI